MLKALTLSGSVRVESSNSRLAKAIGQKLREKGVDVTNIDLLNFPLELFNEDSEAANGEPDAAVKLAKMFTEAHIIFIASPEYNGSVSPLLKNTIDWISRQKTGPYKSATFGIGAASPGKMGGVGGLGHLREILNKLGALVVPLTLGVGNSFNAFTENGEFAEDMLDRRADNMVKQLLNIRRS